MILALVAMISAAICNIFLIENSLAAEPPPLTRIFVLNQPSFKSAGPDSILTLDRFGKTGILFGTQNRVEGARDLVCSPIKPQHILVSVTNFALGKDEILEIDAAGNIVKVISGLGGPASGGSAIGFDHQGNFYIATGGKVFKNGSPFAALPVDEAIGDLAIDSRGNLYVSYPILASKLFRIDPSGNVTLFADAGDGLVHPFGLAVDSADNLFVANNPPSAPGFILKFDPSGMAMPFARDISFQPGIRSMVMSFDENNILYVPLGEDNRILVFNSGGNSEIFADETDGLNAPLGIVIGSCPVEEPLLTIVNERVSFVPIASTFTTTTDTSGCPAGFYGTFSFNASLTNNSNSSLARLMAQIKTLTNNNLLQNAEGGPAGAGAVLLVPEIGEFADRLLSSGESVDVSFNICIHRRPPDPTVGDGGLQFSFFIDVLGIETSDISNSLVQR